MATMMGFVALISSTQADPRPSKKPHIVVYMVDDFGWGNLGFHRTANATEDDRQAAKEAHTPNMDALIDSGVHLDRHYTYRTCSPLAK